LPRSFEPDAQKDFFLSVIHIFAIHDFASLRFSAYLRVSAVELLRTLWFLLRFPGLYAFFRGSLREQPKGYVSTRADVPSNMS